MIGYSKLLLAQVPLVCSSDTLLDVDLQQALQKCIVASDARPFFGFEVSVADADPILVREIRRRGAKPDASASLLEDAAGVPVIKKTRVGQPLPLLLFGTACKTVVYSRARLCPHEGTLDAEGALLALMDSSSARLPQ